VTEKTNNNRVSIASLSISQLLKVGLFFSLRSLQGSFAFQVAVMRQTLRFGSFDKVHVFGLLFASILTPYLHLVSSIVIGTAQRTSRTLHHGATAYLMGVPSESLSIPQLFLVTRWDCSSVHLLYGVFSWRYRSSGELAAYYGVSPCRSEGE
jgi:hypothetical protein